MNYNNDTRPVGSVIAENMDVFTVGTKIWKVYPHRVGGYICEATVTRAPYLDRIGPWMGVEGDSGLFSGGVSLADGGVTFNTYNANRIFLNKTDAENYLNPPAPEKMIEVGGKEYSESTLQMMIKEHGK